MNEAAWLAAILRAPDAEAPYLVYADWLLEQGHPRGELIQVQQALQSSHDPKERARLRAREHRVFATSGDQLMPSWLSSSEVIWRLGFVSHFTLHADAPVRHVGDLAALLHHPSCRVLRSLNVAAVGLSQPDVEAVAQAMGRSFTVYEGRDAPILPHEKLEGWLIPVPRPRGVAVLLWLDRLSGRPLPDSDAFDFCVRTRVASQEWWFASDSRYEQRLLLRNQPDLHVQAETVRGEPDPHLLVPLTGPNEVRTDLRLGLTQGRLRRELHFGAGFVLTPSDLVAREVVLTQGPVTGLPFSPWTPVDWLVMR